MIWQPFHRLPHSVLESIAIVVTATVLLAFASDTTKLVVIGAALLCNAAVMTDVVVSLCPSRSARATHYLVGLAARVVVVLLVSAWAFAGYGLGRGAEPAACLSALVLSATVSHTLCLCLREDRFTSAAHAA